MVYEGKHVLFIRQENLHVCMIMKIDDVGNKIENYWSYIFQ